MSSKKGIIIICFIVTACFALGISVLFLGINAYAFKDQYSSSSLIINTSVFATSFPITSGSIQSSSDIPTSDVMIDGKVVKAFLSPYIANTQYKNIYLNNRTDYEIDIAKIYNSPPDLRIKKCNDPEVLIIHTHATEGYMEEDKETYSQEDIEQTKDSSRSVIAVGEIICDKLEEYGIKAIHDKTLHDDPSYTNSYNRSAETTLKYLEQYPSIKIVIDIHRDSISTDGGLIRGVSEQNGQDAAQIMFVTGSQTGKVTGFENWEENLKLVLRLQEISEKLYPGLARSIYFTSKKYNQHLSTGSLLIEVGSSVNNINEAKYSAELLGNILGIGLNMYAEE